MSIAVESILSVPADHAARQRRVEWALRLGAAACFIGHGAFGIITKAAWVPYFGVVGIDRDLAYTLMPVIGLIDIAAGVLVLFSPRPIVLLYMAIWGLWTALLRPLSGESFFETLERAGNYGVPIALLMMYAMDGGVRGLFARARVRDAIDAAIIGRGLLWSTVVLLFAHGALQAITQKPLFTTLYGAAGLSGAVAPIIGLAEMGVALFVLVAPVPALLLGIAAWKVATEALFPMSGSPIWEFVERASSYAAPVALVLLSGTSLFTRITFPRSDR